LKLLDPVIVREELQDILSKEEYQVYLQENQNVFLRLLERFESWLSDLLEKLFPKVDFVERASEWLVYLIIGIGLSLLIFFLYLLWSRLTGFSRSRKMSVGSSEELAQTPQRHLLEANKLSKQGDQKSALRHAFLAYILFLDEKELIEAKAWKTNWEYFYELKDNDLSKAEAFYDLALKFDEAMYGGRNTNMEDFVVYRDRVISLIEANSPLKSTNHALGWHNES